jgi:pimeloyl-ACP methyl ester carboxylesterase
MEMITSSDGTSIAFRRSGSGPPLVLVHGSTADHTRWASILPELERAYTVFAMDRRGRGQSGDATDYALELEYDDVAAVSRAAGENVLLLGHSFGALCAMEAALRIDNLCKMVLYEPSFPAVDTPLFPADLPGRLNAMLDSGDRELALVTFFTEAAGVPEKHIDALRKDPSWPARVTSVHTAVRELTDGDYVFDERRFRNLTLPVLLLIGENSPESLAAPSRELAAALPNSQVAVLEGQGHIAMTTAPELFLKTVKEFLSL